MKFILALLLLLTSTVHAQERTAAGAIDTQMTWSALSSQISANNTKVEALDAKLNQVVLCGKKGKVYAPGNPAIDTDGCLSAESQGGIRWWSSGSAVATTCTRRVSCLGCMGECTRTSTNPVPAGFTNACPANFREYKACPQQGVGCHIVSSNNYILYACEKD